jgi:formamidopyrimidine-DNA glycosylase
MPELPEVEVVRLGLVAAVTGARVAGVEVRDHRALKRHVPLVGDDGLGGHGVTMSIEAGGLRAADFEQRLSGAVFDAPVRRGKFLWLPLRASHGASAPVGEALLGHLGMSGQLLLRSHDAIDDRHVRVRIWLEHPEHGELRLDFADQRLFGSLAIDRFISTADGRSGGSGSELAAVPGQAAHVARDPLDPAFDEAVFITTLRARNTAVKRALLDQRLISGVGNIYADEALWRARLHPETPAVKVSARKATELLGHVREVFAQALIEGGTSFDTQYVNVNGQAGYFAHSLNAYGRGGEPCPRCGTAIKRVPFGGRSSHFCPRCQRKGLQATGWSLT